MNSEPITCIILDDEQGAVTLLDSLLKEIPNVVVRGSFTKIPDVRTYLVSEQPDVLFLDIRMPGQSGLEIAEDLRNLGIKSNIVFVTGFDEYAISAIKKGAFDYLLKPVDPHELQTCLLRIRAQKEENSISQNSIRRGKVSFSTRRGYIFVNPDDILYIQADVNYSHIFCIDGSRITVSVNLGKVEKILVESGVIRLNRSMMINIGHIDEIRTKPPKIHFEKALGLEPKSISIRSAKALLEKIRLLNES